MSVLIKGGRIVTAADDYVGDVFVDNGTVALIGRSLDDVTADKTIDATGKLVMPGAVDPHTHIEMYFGGTVTCDDFTSGTVSAAFGGTTTLVDFCMQAPGTSFAQALETYHEKVDRCKPVIDVGFHIGVTDLRTGGSLEELAKLPDEGITSYKLFMAYDRHPRQGGRRRRQPRPDLARAHASAGDRGRGDEPRGPARAGRRRAAVRRPRLVQGVDRADPDRAREGLEHPRRDLHPVPLRR
jgi:dihydroorotase-like cyclic amidohydrolase